MKRREILFIIVVAALGTIVFPYMSYRKDGVNGVYAYIGEMVALMGGRQILLAAAKRTRKGTILALLMLVGAGVAVLALNRARPAWWLLARYNAALFVGSGMLLQISEIRRMRSPDNDRK